MAYSYNDFGPKGPGDTITVGFPFLHRDHVSVLVDGVEVDETKWAWLSDGLISCLAGFPSGAGGRVLRTTPDSGLEGRLVGTASFDYPMVNSNFDKTLYILQEKADGEADREARTVVIEAAFATQQGNLDAAVAVGLAARDVTVSAKDTSVSAAGTSVAASGLSQKWASEQEDVEVSGGLFSAYHWAQKALAVASSMLNGLGGLIHGASSKADPIDADEFGFSDSAGSAWGLKKLSWADIKAALKTYMDSLYAPQGRTLTAAGLVTGGGTLGANRTFTVTKSTNAQAVAGTDDATAMTPIRTKEAIAALTPSPNYATGNAALAYGGVGTYALLKKNGTGTLAADATIAGSGMAFALIAATGSVSNSGIPSGTWRNMGGAINNTDSTVCLRIS